MNLYLDLFLTFAKVGVCTFGGGYAMLPILQREVVDGKGWATESELADYYAVGQCTPGIIAVNTATFVGAKEKGVPGGIAATLGLIFRVGLFSVGGGLATIPFLTDLGTRTGWFTPAELANMVAVSESTPGPMGVNMATYVGFETNGPMGCVIATLGLITPSIIIILVIARFLQKFRQSRTVDAVFYGLRPASTALIASAGFLSVAKVSLLFWQEPLPEPGILFTHLFNGNNCALE